MNKLLLMLLIILVISGCSQKELTWDDLVTRGDITYIKFTETPFTGKLIDYYPDGQLSAKGSFKNGKKEGMYESFCEWGMQNTKQGYKNGELHGKSFISSCSFNFKDEYSCFVENKKQPDYACDRIYVGHGGLVGKIKNYLYWLGRDIGIIK